MVDYEAMQIEAKIAFAAKADQVKQHVAKLDKAAAAAESTLDM